MTQLELLDIKKKLPPTKTPLNPHNTHKIGDYAELLVLTRLLKEGHTVALPYGSQPGWDILVEVDGHWQKWQIKTGTLRKDRRKRRRYYDQKSVHLTWHSKATHHTYQPRDFDYLIAVFPDTNEMFKIPIQNVLTKQYIGLQTDKYKW